MTDAGWMSQALALAALAEGATHPNPLVGCVVVKDGALVGRGIHRAAGEPHAEVAALAEAGARARGAALYVNLEPCAHHGRTPPCAEAIVAAGVARVVAAISDPNPMVDGRGLATLRAAGIAVETGLLEAEARALNAPFLSLHLRKRPAVTVKAAQSLDGRIAARAGSSTWITGEASRRFAHRLRLAHENGIVGAGTIRADDPALTVRLPGITAPRLRVVLSATGEIDPAARVFTVTPPSEPRTRVYVPRAARDRAAALGSVADVVPVGGGPSGIDVGEVLFDLAAVGIRSVLVEGGGRTIAAFVTAGLADQAALFVAPSWIGERGATPVLDLPAADAPAKALRLDVRRSIPIGRDRLLLATVSRD